MHTQTNFSQPPQSYSKYTVGLNMQRVSQCNLLIKYGADTEKDREGGTTVCVVDFTVVSIRYAALSFSEVAVKNHMQTHDTSS